MICFALQGRYLSRNLRRVVNDIIAKALAAFSATGMDPYRYCVYCNLGMIVVHFLSNDSLRRLREVV